MKKQLPKQQSGKRTNRQAKRRVMHPVKLVPLQIAFRPVSMKFLKQSGSTVVSCLTQLFKNLQIEIIRLLCERLSKKIHLLTMKN